MDAATNDRCNPCSRKRGKEGRRGRWPIVHALEWNRISENEIHGYTRHAYSKLTRLKLRRYLRHSSTCVPRTALFFLFSFFLATARITRVLFHPLNRKRWKLKNTRSIPIDWFNRGSSIHINIRGTDLDRKKLCIEINDRMKWNCIKSSWLSLFLANFR